MDGTSESFILEYSELSIRNQQLEEQVHNLQTQVEDFEHDIEHFELVRSDWESEKEALEGVLMKMRSELREKEEVLNIVQAQKVIICLQLLEALLMW